MCNVFDLRGGTLRMISVGVSSPPETPHRCAARCAGAALLIGGQAAPCDGQMAHPRASRGPFP